MRTLPFVLASGEHLRDQSLLPLVCGQLHSSWALLCMRTDRALDTWERECWPSCDRASTCTTCLAMPELYVLQGLLGSW